MAGASRGSTRNSAVSTIFTPPAEAAPEPWRDRVARLAGVYSAVRRGNGTLAALRFLALNALGIRRTATLVVEGCRLRLRTATPDVFVAVETLQTEFEAAAAVVDRGRAGLVIDAGGYIGTAAIRLSRMMPNARVVTVEPNRTNFEILTENVAAFPNITPVNAALAPDGAASNLTLFDRGGTEVGYTIIADAADAATRGGARALYEVPTVSIEGLMREHASEEIVFLKLDVEGAEYAILKDRPAWVSRVLVMMVELHERIAPGCLGAFLAATAGRSNRQLDGEKILSLKPAS